MRIRTAVVAAIVLLFGLTLATAAGAQTQPTNPDYSPICIPSSNSLGVVSATGHLSAGGVSQTVDPNCPPTDVGGNQLGNSQVSGQPLARTGSDSTVPMVQIGLALLAVGGLVVLFARSRRRRPTAAAG